MTQSIPQTLPAAQTLQCVIAWLEGGCDPKLAAKELRLLLSQPMGVAGIPEGYPQRVIDELYENGDPVSVDAAELLTKMLAAAKGE